MNNCISLFAGFNKSDGAILLWVSEFDREEPLKLSIVGLLVLNG